MSDRFKKGVANDHLFQIATGSLNAAPGGIRPFQLTGTMVSSAVTVLSGMAVGVWMTL
jgi:hypothetical protein